MRLYRVTAVEEAARIIKENFTSLELESITLDGAGGRITGLDILASEDVPGFNRSTVDGYAVRAADTFGASETLPAMLQLAGEVKMGEPAPPLPQGSAIYVPTGGMLPEGADAMVMIEDTEVLDDLVNCLRQAAPGENVIYRGEDVAKGSMVIPTGRRLRAPEIGVLASLGIHRLKVVRKPRVGILSTGNEIVSYKTVSLAPGEVRDSNAHAIQEITRKCGATPVYGGILQDSYSVLKHEIEKLLAQVDFLVLSGGSSVGTKDFTAKILEELSENGLLIEGIAIQPGKPTLLARCQGKPVLGLPGHPVSALNIFSLFGTAILAQLLGVKGEEYNPGVRARLAKNIPSRIGRTDYVRVRLERDGGVLMAVPIFGRSGLLRTLADARGLVVVPSGSEGLPAGREVDVLLWDY